MPAVRAWRAPVAIALSVIALDQLTKHWAVTSLGTDREIDLFWTLRFNLAFNTGMSFSRGAGMGPLISVIAVVVIVILLRSTRTPHSRLTLVAIGAIVGGAAGNVIDRLFRGEAWSRGAVVDFIDPQWFPIFNVADSAIVVGAALLILNSILSARAHRRESGDGEPERLEHTAEGDVG
jgi:signal peptidase II